MILRTLVASTALALGTLVVPTAPAHAAAKDVVVDDMSFKPGTVGVRIGQKVIWKFEDTFEHTTTSNQGFWDSGTRSAGEQYALRFPSAGTYGYHCEVHSGMKGKVRVRMTKDGGPAQGWTLRWSTGPAPVGRNFDIQYKRKSADGWSGFRTNTLKAEATFNPRREGTYLFRARTSNTEAEESTRWSPVTKALIS